MSAQSSNNTRPVTSNNEFPSQIGHAVQEIHPIESNNFDGESNQQYSGNRQYDIMPPGVEPPPPGFENESTMPSSQQNRYSREREWSVDYKTDKEKSNEQRQSRRQVLLFDISIESLFSLLGMHF